MNYRYQALTADGRLERGEAEAADRAALSVQLQQRGLDLLRARRCWRQPARPDRRDLLDFCLQLEILLRAGIPLLEALRELGDSARPAMHAALSQVCTAIEGGAQFSSALSVPANAFPPLLIRLVAAGEQGGRLPATLAALGEHLRWQDELATRTGKALLYPGCVLLIVGAVTAFLLGSVVPPLERLIVQMQAPIPLTSTLLFALAALVHHHGPSLALGIGLIGMSGGYWLTRPAGRRQLRALGERLPLIAGILRNLELARFAATLTLLYKAGIPVLDALRHAEAIAVSPRLRQAIHLSTAAIQGGATLTSACAAQAAFPALLLRLMRVGEQSGRLDETLHHAAELYRRAARDAAERLQTLLEPALTLVLGALIGWIMLAVLGPIYDIVGRVRP